MTPVSTFDPWVLFAENMPLTPTPVVATAKRTDVPCGTVMLVGVGVGGAPVGHWKPGKWTDSQPMTNGSA